MNTEMKEILFCFGLTCVVVFTMICAINSVNHHSNYLKEIKSKCEELCFNKTIEDHYKCATACYEWKLK